MPLPSLTLQFKNKEPQSFASPVRYHSCQIGFHKKLRRHTLQNGTVLLKLQDAGELNYSVRVSFINFSKKLKTKNPVR